METRLITEIFEMCLKKKSVEFFCTFKKKKGWEILIRGTFFLYTGYGYKLSQTLVLRQDDIPHSDNT